MPAASGTSTRTRVAPRSVDRCLHTLTITQGIQRDSLSLPGFSQINFLLLPLSFPPTFIHFYFMHTVYNSTLPSKARSNVTSSIYSRSPPTGTPLAILGHLDSCGLDKLADIHCRGLTSRLELVAIMTSSTSPCRRSISSFSLMSPGPTPSIGQMAPCSTW